MGPSRRSPAPRRSTKMGGRSLWRSGPSRKGWRLRRMILQLPGLRLFGAYAYARRTVVLLPRATPPHTRLLRASVGRCVDWTPKCEAFFRVRCFFLPLVSERQGPVVSRLCASSAGTPYGALVARRSRFHRLCSERGSDIGID